MAVRRADRRVSSTQEVGNGSEHVPVFGGSSKAARASVVDRKIQVLIAEPTFLVRRGLTSLLGSFPEVGVCGEIGTAGELQGALRDRHPDVVIVDAGLKASFEASRTSLIQQLRSSDPPGGLVVLCADDGEAALPAFHEGAEGIAYLMKRELDGSDRLLHAVTEVAMGGSFFDAVFVNLLVERRTSKPLLNGLTAREIEVLAAIAEGLTNSAIARILFVTEGAVEKHINSVYRKLGITIDSDHHQRVAAVLAYLEGDFVRPIAAAG